MATSLDTICNKSECTFSQTGKCVLDNDPVICSDRLASLVALRATESVVSGEPVLLSPKDAERFTSSLSLGITDIEMLMAKRKCKLVGILGVPGTGKTAGLASLYLLLAHNKLMNFRFLDSKSIMAFEEICRGARKWNEADPPEQLTVHTELQDERIAGFLHLRVENTSTEVKTDLLFTDLPGEWTSSLIDKNRSDRWAFLAAASRIWITANSLDIINLEQRHLTVHRLSLLLQRLKAFLGSGMPEVSIVLTHCDRAGSVHELLSELLVVGEGIRFKIFEIASFSASAEIEPGAGIKELLDDVCAVRSRSEVKFWPSRSNLAGVRNILLYKNPPIADGV
jgi:hypothetical protein